MSEKQEGFVAVTSRAQWDAIEDRLRGLYFSKVNFRVDGHFLSVQRRFIGEGKTSLWVYVDGKIEYKYMMPDKTTGLFDPLIERVWRPRVTHLVSPQKKTLLLAKWKGKRLSKKRIAWLMSELGFDKKFMAYVPDYASAKMLVRRFRKIDGIEVGW